MNTNQNQNVLDAIVNAQAGFDGGAHSFENGARVTENGARHIQALAMQASAYRGQGIDVRKANNDPQAVMDLAGMNWKTVKMPLAIQGKNEYRPLPGMNALAEAQEFVQNAARAFNGHVDKLAKLRTVKSNVTLDLMQLTELFQPELAKRIADVLVRPTTAVAGDVQEHSILGARVLDAIMTRDASRGIVAGLIQDGADRLLNKVIEATMQQPGGEMTVGTLAHAYSGVTNFNSNLRGRSAETGLEANLFGTYQNDSHRALELAVNVAGAMGRMN